MPPQLRHAVIGLSKAPIRAQSKGLQSICLFCSISQGRRFPRAQQPQLRTRRSSSRTLSDATTGPLAGRSVHPGAGSSRTQLKESLIDLQKYASNSVNPSRLQLALRGLEQIPGEETIRIALLGAADGGNSLQKAKELLRLVLADPLKPEEEWERTLVAEEQNGLPLLIRVGMDGELETNSAGRLVKELKVSSPVFNGHKLEILVLELVPPIDSGSDTFKDATSVPTMEIPTSSSGRYTPVTTPVHKSLIVSEGIMGAASLAGYPSDIDRDIIGMVADLKVEIKEQERLPFMAVDIAQAKSALRIFRESVENALPYEQNWFASGVPEIVNWLKSGTASSESMKRPVRNLIESVVTDTATSMRLQLANNLSAALSSEVSASDLDALRKALSEWAENAHTELRDQLDAAFDSRRWRKLGWWKLFWRVDDVSMISSDILNQRFLTDADKEIIFLAGQIAQAGVIKDQPAANWAYKPVEQNQVEAKLGAEPPPPRIRDLIAPRDRVASGILLKPWPLHIPIARAYLTMDTVPALQALAQKLVLQTFTTSSFSTIFAGLMFYSTLSTGLYEAGAVAAVGIVWSLRRMQGKWEAARKFWEGEVREEGRKAVRGVEEAVSGVLATQSPHVEEDIESQKVEETIERANSALRSL